MKNNTKCYLHVVYCNLCNRVPLFPTLGKGLLGLGGFMQTLTETLTGVKNSSQSLEEEAHEF
jgi:hypothetical protein